MLRTISKKSAKKIALVGLLVLFGLAVVFFSYKYFTRNNNGTSTDAAVAPVQSQEEITDRVSRSEQFKEIIRAVNSGDNQKTVDLSSAFAADSANDNLPRLDAYRVCIEAAQVLGDNETKVKCYDDAKKLANSESDETIKSSWLTTLENAFNGTEPETSSDDVESQ